MELKVKNKILKLPAFFPDATLGVIKSIDSKDLENCKINGIVINTYHILRHNLNHIIKKAGGIHKYINYNGIIISDSGGFQVMSLIKNNRKFGKIEEDKVIFKSENKIYIFTPEECIRLQLELGSDIIMCLDDCTTHNCDKNSVEKTIKWAKKCKEEFVRLTKNLEQKPLIFGIIQGGNNKELRKYCAEELIKINFDGYSFGGWPIEDGVLMKDILKFTSNLIPNNLPKYAMGIGKPEDIIVCGKMGYNMFDCVLPTRDARHKRLYISNGVLHISKNENKDNLEPISKECDCYTCQNYSRAYLHNLFKIKENLAFRLATIHNLRFYSKLLEEI